MQISSTRLFMQWVFFQSLHKLFHLHAKYLIICSILIMLLEV
jgi:hypothetical protein